VSGDSVTVRLLFADQGVFREEEVRIPSASLQGYERLIDAVREDVEVQKRLHVDMGRLCAAFRVD